MTDHARRLATRRAETLAAIDALSGRLDGIIDASRYETNDDEHDPEGVTVAFERAQTASLLAMANTELRALDAADARLAAGTYGVCARCGGRIAAARLDALPTAERCIGCADRR